MTEPTITKLDATEATSKEIAVIELKVGDSAPDGSIYAGQVNGKEIYAAPQDAEEMMNFPEAEAYAAQRNKEEKKEDKEKFSWKKFLASAWKNNTSEKKKKEIVGYLGHKDWHVATEEELDLLYKNRNEGKLAGTFNVAGGWYGTSTTANKSCGRVQWFSEGSGMSDGYKAGIYKGSKTLIRLVRS